MVIRLRLVLVWTYGLEQGVASQPANCLRQLGVGMILPTQNIFKQFSGSITDSFNHQNIHKPVLAKPMRNR